MHGLRLLAAFAITLGLTLTACSDDEDDPTDAGSGKPPAEMVGTWRFASVTVDGAPADLVDVLEWHPMAVAAEMMIQANSAHVYQEVNTGGGQLWFVSGFVFIDGTEIDVNAQQDADGPVNETTRYAFTLANDVFTLQRTAQSVTTVFTLNNP